MMFSDIVFSPENHISTPQRLGAGDLKNGASLNPFSVLSRQGLKRIYAVEEGERMRNEDAMGFEAI